MPLCVCFAEMRCCCCKTSESVELVSLLWLWLFLLLPAVVAGVAQGLNVPTCKVEDSYYDVEAVMQMLSYRRSVSCLCRFLTSQTCNSCSVLLSRGRSVYVMLCSARSRTRLVQLGRRWLFNNGCSETKQRTNVTQTSKLTRPSQPPQKREQSPKGAIVSSCKPDCRQFSSDTCFLHSVCLLIVNQGRVCFSLAKSKLLP